ANGMEFRMCVNPNDVIICGNSCVLVGDAEFFLQPPRTVAVKVVPRLQNSLPSIYRLNNCVIIDDQNWSCTDDDQNFYRLAQMVDGKYHTRTIVDGKSSPSHCAR